MIVVSAPRAGLAKGGPSADLIAVSPETREAIPGRERKSDPIFRPKAVADFPGS